MVRPLAPHEIDAMLDLAVPLHLATIDDAGLPHITPLWFEWDGSAFWMTSLRSKPHVLRLRRNGAASICLDVEDDERDDGERPNRQVRAVGTAELVEDTGGERTARITARYLHGAGRQRMIELRASAARVAIRLEPVRVIAVASV